MPPLFFPLEELKKRQTSFFILKACVLKLPGFPQLLSPIYAYEKLALNYNEYSVACTLRPVMSAFRYGHLLSQAKPHNHSVSNEKRMILNDKQTLGVKFNVL